MTIHQQIAILRGVLVVLILLALYVTALLLR